MSVWQRLDIYNDPEWLKDIKAEADLGRSRSVQTGHLKATYAVDDGDGNTMPWECTDDGRWGHYHITIVMAGIALKTVDN